MILLSAENISKEFPVEGGVFRRKIGSVRALDSVSLRLEEGESVGVVGESGSGKTTLAKILLRMLAPDVGKLLWEGKPAESISRRDWAHGVQMVFQDPSASLNPKLTVHTQLTEALRARKSDPAEPRLSANAEKDALRELLVSVGLPWDALFYYPHQFSGGQKQRIAIARALADRPRLLIADEPVSSLDLSIQAQILNLLMDLKDHYRLTLLTISHDLAVISYLAGRVVVMKQGKVVEEGATADVLSRPADAYTKALLDAVPRLETTT